MCVSRPKLSRCGPPCIPGPSYLHYYLKYHNSTNAIRHCLAVRGVRRPLGELPRPSSKSPFSTHRAVGAGKPCLLAITHTLSPNPRFLHPCTRCEPVRRDRPQSAPRGWGGGTTTDAIFHRPANRPHPVQRCWWRLSNPTSVAALLWDGYRRPRFVLPVTLLFLPVGHTRTWCRRNSPRSVCLLPRRNCAQRGIQTHQGMCGEMPLSAASGPSALRGS